MNPDTNLYERGFAQWSARQAESLRRRAANEINWENVAEEIESLGRSDWREIRNQLVTIREHLLKWQFQADRCSAGWRRSIIEVRGQISDLIEESPSRAGHPATGLDAAYRRRGERAEPDGAVWPDGYPAETC